MNGENHIKLLTNIRKNHKKYQRRLGFLFPLVELVIPLDDDLMDNGHFVEMDNGHCVDKRKNKSIELPFEN